MQNKLIPGQILGHWTVIRFIETLRGSYDYYECKCVCGTVRRMDGYAFFRKKPVRSCGCFKKHGRTHSPEFDVWHALKKRCYLKTDSQYHNYGGRGIRVCERWLGKDGFANFYADMGPRPSDEHSIDRFPDNNGNYEPGNCRWATEKQQKRNQRRNHRVTFNGETLTLVEWSERTGISPFTLGGRLEHGWSVERALTQPVRKRAKNRRA